ncbi:MAG: hypothetical protein JWN74_31 [Acidobacteriaceae bacterium]|nr:hypothetical protein [Acidobacteriaceae bacterium]
MKSYGKLVGGLIAAWFVLAFSASAMHAFETGSQRVGLAVAVAALTPIIVFSVWFATSEQFRQFALSVNPRILTLMQTWRILGLVFVILEARKLLPAVFAFPAGYGDIAIGATAWFAALKLANPKRRNSFILWQSLGITDLIVAVSLGTTAVLISPHAPSMLPLTVLPLSLVPTFLVPLFMIFHVICIAQARMWRTAAADSRASGEPLRSVAV